jgi:hypothetical protein
MGKALQSSVMNEAEDSAAQAQTWLASLLADDGAALTASSAAGNPAPALATLATTAIARERTLMVVTAGDEPLTDISNAVDLGFRPLCLVLPDANYATRIALRATLSLLKSRLARACDGDMPAWAAQRRRMGEETVLWHECLAWSNRGLDTEPWPPDLLRLFPVRVLPLQLARRMQATADWIVVVDAARQPEDARIPWPGARRTLLLYDAVPKRSLPTPADATSRLRAEVEVLTQELSELELELATAQAEIADFTRRYHALIGMRMTLLDELRAELAAKRAAADPENLDAARAADSAQTRAEQSRQESERFAGLEENSFRPFAPSVDLKKLYRKLAQKIHPDRARDEDDRAWRTQLMTEANRAYRSGDESALREVFALWAEGGHHETTTDGDALAVQVDRLKRRIAEIERELNRLFGSKLYELFTAANIARRTGRDLLQEMTDRLDVDIAGIRSQLAA